MSSVCSYGDECLGGKLSLLHFCVTFLMAGVIVLVVGAVQFKPEAEMFEYRQVIVTLGCAILGFGEKIGENIQGVPTLNMDEWKRQFCSHLSFKPKNKTISP